ncbi:MAG: hypothetical protein QM756_24230 [Polyangiaceae bacterium]
MLPDALRALLQPLLSPAVLIGLGVFSVVTFVASIIGVPGLFVALAGGLLHAA